MVRALLLSTALLLSRPVQAQRRQGQARLDSLLDARSANAAADTSATALLAAISYEYNRIDPAEGIVWGDRALTAAQHAGWLKGVQLAYTALAANHLQRDESARALDACFKAFGIAEAGKDSVAMSRLLSLTGSAYMFGYAAYSQALDYDLHALRLAERIGDSACVAEALAGAAAAYTHTQRAPLALPYQQRALVIAEELDDDILRTRLYGSMGVTYANMNRKNPELACYFKALPMARASGNQVAIANITGNIGGAYHNIAQRTDVRPDSLISASSRTNLARGIFYLREASTLAIRIHAFDNAKTYLRGLASALSMAGDFKSALEVKEEERAIVDSLNHATNIQAIAKLETARALQLKDKDLQIAKLAVAKKRNERTFYIAGIALLLIILGILIFSFRRHERARRRIRVLQDHKISLLDKAVRQRTEQLNSMRQTVATDFHDQTGNMLAAINRQAAILEMKLHANPELLPLVQSITANSNDLYASSKDFLWNLNNNSDNPLTLFRYLTAYGQHFSNQFDIAFSAEVTGAQEAEEQLSPFAALNLIYIIKEAMSNVIKHSGADEVTMTMAFETGRVVYTLADNGRWKEATPGVPHYGLDNMERRCKQAGFGYGRSHGDEGTRIAVSLPLTAYFIHNHTP